MFAQCAVRHTSLGVTVIIGRSPASFAAGKHHSKNAPLSADKSAFFVGAEGGIVYSNASKLTSELDAFFGMNANPACCASRTSSAPPTRKKQDPQKEVLFFWRRGRDSNPRVVSHKLISSQPRYDRFDTSAYMAFWKRPKIV